MKEEFLIYLWKFQLFDYRLSTTTGDKLQIISPGTRNLDSGPDFFNAMIQIEDTTWAGNVEIHIKSSDWFQHNHQNDKSYSNIILHVVFDHDKNVNTEDGILIPTLELRRFVSKNLISKYLNLTGSLVDIPCNKFLNEVSQVEKTSWFDFLITERFESRFIEFQRNYKNSRGSLLEIYYQNLARSIGYYTNAECMEFLARKTPLRLLLSNRNNLIYIEALLFGQSGLLSEQFNDPYPVDLLKEYKFLKSKYKLDPMIDHTWKFMRMRPASFPTIRISQLANLLYFNTFDLAGFFESDSLKELKVRLKVEASPYWNNHYRFDTFSRGNAKKLGNSSIELIIINAIAPSMFNYGISTNNSKYCDKAVRWFSELKPEKNRIIRKFQFLGLSAESALDSQAMIQLYKKYCLKKKCISCRFGHIFLNRSF